MQGLPVGVRPSWRARHSAPSTNTWPAESLQRRTTPIRPHSASVPAWTRARREPAALRVTTQRPSARRRAQPDADRHRERRAAAERGDDDDPAGDQRHTAGHAEHPAGHVSLGHDEHGTNEQQRKAERGHSKSSTTMIRAHLTGAGTQPETAGTVIERAPLGEPTLRLRPSPLA